MSFVINPNREFKEKRSYDSYLRGPRGGKNVAAVTRSVTAYKATYINWGAEKLHMVFCFFIFGVTQVIFYLGKMVYLEVFEVLGQDNKAAGELKIGKLSILNRNFGSSNLFLLLGNQLNQFFFGK